MVPALLVQQSSMAVGSPVFFSVRAIMSFFHCAELSRKFRIGCESRRFHSSVRHVNFAFVFRASYHAMFGLVCEVAPRFRFSVRTITGVVALMCELSRRLSFSFSRELSHAVFCSVCELAPRFRCSVRAVTGVFALMCELSRRFRCSVFRNNKRTLAPFSVYFANYHAVVRASTGVSA